MGTGNKAASKAREVMGKIKKKIGQAIGNPRLEAEGRVDQTEGDLRQAGEKLKDAVKE